MISSPQLNVSYCAGGTLLRPQFQSVTDFRGSERVQDCTAVHSVRVACRVERKTGAGEHPPCLQAAAASQGEGELCWITGEGLVSPPFC